MELKVEGELCLRGFSPHQVSYLPSLNCVLVSDGRGAFRCVDIASGKEHSLPEITVPDFSSHVLCDVDQTTSKLVVVCGNKLSARLAHAGALQLRTMLQTPVKSMQEEVTVELPLSACSTLLKELKAPHSGRRTASLKMVVSIERTLEEALAKSSNCDKFATVCFSGPLGQLSSLFEELSKSLLTGDKSPGHPATPLLFALTLKLHLLDPENGPAMMGFERGDALSSNEARLMNIEAMRRLSLAGWPHLNYQWAVPKVMAKAGFYQTTSINHGGTAAGDRVTCFCCRVYLYSWEPTDEPWSEHERHAFQCRFVRGEYTANVPLAITESSHPASEYTHDRDTVCCMSTSIGTGLVALGTEQGRIAVWDLDRGLFIIEHAHLDLTEDHVSMYLDMAVPLTSDSSPSSSHSQDEDATFQQATVPLLVDTPAPPDPLPEHIKDVEQSSIINKDPNTNQISAAVETEGTPSSMPTIELTPDTKDTVLVNPSLQPSSPTDTDSTDISSEQTIEEDVKMKFSEDPETEPVSKKRRFHVTALSVVSVEKHVLSTSTPEICTAVLITGVTMFRDNKCDAMLMLHKVCSKIRKKRKSQKPPSTYISPIAIDLDPEYIPLMDHPSMQPPVYSNQSWEAPSKAGTDDPELPATLEYSQSFSLGNDIVPSDFEGLPQIRQIVPLDSGRLLAVSCTVSTSDSILKEDKSDSSTCTLFVISLSQNGHITASSFCVIPVDEPVVCIRALSDNSETHSEDSNNPILLAALFGSGRVVVYDVSLPSPLPVATYQCSNCEDPTSRMVDCTYCPATCQLAVTTSNGKLWMLGLDKGSDETKQIKMEDLKQDLQTRSLTPSELDQLSVLTESSPEGIEFTGSTPQDWRQISLHQYHRGSPSHLFNGGRGKAVTGNKKAWQTGRVWLYQPPSGISSRTKCRYKFELSPVPHSEYPISSIAITLNIASSQCLKETASLSLLRPKWTTPTRTDPSECDTLLGPIKIKSLVDITGKSLTVVLSHPLLAVTAPPILWLLFEDLFAPNYNKVSFSAEPLTDTTATRGAWRTKAFRHYVKQPPNDQTKSKFVSVQATLSVTLHKSSRPLADLGPLMSPKLLPLLVCDPLFMTKLAIIACGGVVKEGERPLEAADLLSKRVVTQVLDLLCWIACLHCNTPNSEGYSLLVNSLSVFLTSLLHACFARGDRTLSHKAARLLVTLYRAGEEGMWVEKFREVVSQSLLSLLPLVPLFPSAACVHWLFRVIAIVTNASCHERVMRECVGLLVGLSRELQTRNTLPAQLLQTYFKRDLSIFEPDLFDIFLSYSQKSATTVTVKTTSKPAPILPPSIPSIPTPMPQAALDDPNFEFTYESVYNIMPNLVLPQMPHMQHPPIFAASMGKDHQIETRVVVNNGNTIYDSELQLLMDCKEQSEQKVIEEYPTFKHGSFLLYSQRGLLETLPLEYSCLRVTGNAAVKAASLQSVRKSRVDATTSSVPMTSLTKTSGYCFPTDSVPRKKPDKVSIDNSNQDRSSMTRLPSSVTDISISPRELMMHIESIKSGVSYAATLELGPCEVELTDLCIQSSPVMSSVCVDVWSGDGGESEAVRVAHSSELSHKSLMLGNIYPPPICRFVKVTFIGRLGLSRDKAQVFIGTFYGRPIPPSPPSPIQLFSLEESILSQYHTSREKLISDLLAFSQRSSASSTGMTEQYEDEVNHHYKQCFRAQVQLARLRNWRKCQENCTYDGQLSVEQLASSGDMSTLSASKLIKLIGCTIDTLLTLNKQPSSGLKQRSGELLQETLETQQILSEDDCSMLFSTLCVHGTPKSHARACAFLIQLCGSQPWWGHFVTKTAVNLLSDSHTAVFNQDRALLQLSALSQRTYDCTNVLTSLLTQLSNTLQGSHDHPGRDNTLLQWLVLLLSHILSSLTLKTTSKSHPNLFQPSPLMITPPPDNSMAWERSRAAVNEIQDKKMTIRLQLSRLRTEIRSATGEQKVKLMAESEALKKDYREYRVTPLKPPVLGTPSMGAKKRPPAKPTETQSSSPLLTFLSSELCQRVAKGLLGYALALANEGEWNLVPVTCKLFSLLLAHSRTFFGVRTLVSQQQLHHLMVLTCQSFSPRNQVEWGKRALQCMLMNALHHGEIKRYEHTKRETGTTKQTTDPKDRLVSKKVKVTEILDQDDESNEASGSVVVSEVSVDVGSSTILETDSLSHELISLDSLLSEATAAHELEQEDSGDKDIDPQQAAKELLELLDNMKDTQPAADVATEQPQDSTYSNPLRSTDEKKVSDSKERKSKLSKLEIIRKKLASRRAVKTVKTAAVTKLEIPTNNTEQRQQSLLYMSFIISNTVETRLLCSCQLSPELQLQAFSQVVYESILSSLINARPRGSTTLTPRVVGEILPPRKYPFEKTMTFLLNSIEHLLEQAREPHSNIDLVATLQFWEELSSLFPAEKTVFKNVGSGEERFFFPINKDFVPPLSSNVVFIMLLDSLIGTSSKSSKLWQLSICLMHTSLIELVIRAPRRWWERDPRVQVKFRQVLLKMLSIPFTAQDIDKEIVEAFLRCVCSISFRNRQNDGMWHGSNFLLDILIQLQDGDKSLLESPLLHTLLSVLGEPANLSSWWKNPSNTCYQTVGLVHQLCLVMVDWLPWLLEKTDSPGVRVFGNEMDDDRKRYNRYPGSAQPEVKWVQLSRDNTHDTANLTPKFIQFLRDILSVSIPDEALLPLHEYCRNTFHTDASCASIEDELPSCFEEYCQNTFHTDASCASIEDEPSSFEDVLQLVTEFPLLVLLFKDTQLLTKLFKLLNSLPTESNDKKCNLSHDLFTNFFHFLIGHCRDNSYFFQPILQVLSATPGRSNISILFRNLISRLMSDFVKQGDSHKLVNFIRGGGGKLIIECLVMSCKSPYTGGLKTHSVSVIGTKKRLKPFSETSKLVNFLPFASICCKPDRTLATELTTSGPSRSSTLHHTFNSSEHWLVLNITLPFPVLLHCVQLFQPTGLTQSGPSSVFLKVSSQGGVGNALPITPPIQTSGLSNIKIEFQQPQIAQEVVVYLGRPFASNSLALSHMHLLGLAYGSGDEEQGKENVRGAGGYVKNRRDEQSAGWLNILEQWMTVSELTREALISVCSTVPSFLPSCLSLLSNHHTLSRQSSSQLQSVLVMLSADSPEFGDDIIKYLLGHSSSRTTTQQAYSVGCQTSVSPVAMELVLSLCRPTTDSSKQRLDMAIRLLSNQVSPLTAPTSHQATPTLVRALSSAVWGETRCYSEEDFRSLAEFAFSTEVGHPLMSPLNSLLCALCNAHPPLYTLILSRCQEALNQGLPLQNLLQTLAKVSQSSVATNTLLVSKFSSLVMSQLLEGFDWLLSSVVNAGSAEIPDESREKDEVQEKMKRVSMYLAFLTDFVRNWTPAKDWVGNQDNRRIWASIFAFFCSGACSSVSAVNLAFLQDVVCEFFSACVHNHATNKSLFVQLFCNSLRGGFDFDSCTKTSDSDSESRNETDKTTPLEDCILTPFLHKILTELILCHESIPLVLICKSSNLKTTPSLALCHDAINFHPSFGVGSHHYYLELPRAVSIKSLEAIFNKDVEVKPAQIAPLTLLRRRAVQKVTKPLKPPVEPSRDLKLSNFKIKDHSLITSVPSDSQSTVAFKLLDARDGICLESTVPIVLVLESDSEQRSIKTVSTALTDSSQDLLESFLSEKGLSALAQCLPALYHYHWPQSWNTESKRPSQVFLDLPSMLPAHSVFMLGLCLRISCYGDLLKENPSVTLVLLRLLLKAKIKEPLSNRSLEEIAFLPYLIFLEALKQFPSNTEEGNVLRLRALEVGVVSTVVRCMAFMGRYSPRREVGKESQGEEQSKSQRNKKVVSHDDSHYWAKGTGFGTGSTTSNWDIEATLAKKKLEEKYIALCFTILAEYLEVKGHTDATPTDASEELVEMLGDSCLLPALASYLHNDSVLDISKHVDLYHASLDLLFSLASNQITQHLLLVPVFSSEEEVGPDIITLASLMARLRGIAEIYKKTAGIAPSRQASPSKPGKPRRCVLSNTRNTKSSHVLSDKIDHQDKNIDSNIKDKPEDAAAVDVASKDADSKQVVAMVDPNQLEPTSDPKSPPSESEHVDFLFAISTPIDPHESTPPLIPQRTASSKTDQKPANTDDGELAILVDKILSTSDLIIEVVTVIRMKRGGLEPQTLSQAPEKQPGSYSRVMGPLQFDTFQFTEEDENGRVQFHCPFFYQSKVQKTSASSSSAARARRLAQEVSSLSTSLPLSPSSSVFVRCDEDRLDVMKVLITGPSETPYANGCFEFDVFFPPDYPQVPMLVNLMTTGQKRVRFNPNLYNDGKVCLSVLNTWHGRPEEKWNGQNSSFLQVLVSIQSLIFVPEPYFNEPGYERYRGTPHGDNKSLAYNANLYVANMQWAMINQLRNPTPCFKEVILKHFHERRAEVLAQCEEWKRELAAGVRRLQEKGETTTHLNTHLQNLNKSIDTLHSEIEKINS